MGDGFWKAKAIAFGCGFGTVRGAAEEKNVCMSLDVGKIDWVIAKC